MRPAPSASVQLRSDRAGADAFVALVGVGGRGRLHPGALVAQAAHAVVAGALEQRTLRVRIGRGGVGDGVDLGGGELTGAQRGLGGRELGEPIGGVERGTGGADGGSGGGGQP